MKSTKTHPLISKFIIYYVAIECVVYLVGMREKEGLVKLLELKNCGLLYWKLKLRLVLHICYIKTPVTERVTNRY